MNPAFAIGAVSLRLRVRRVSELRQIPPALACLVAGGLLACPPARAQEIDVSSEDEGLNSFAGVDTGISAGLAEGVELTARAAYLDGSFAISVTQADVQIAIHPNVTVGPGYFGFYPAATADRPDPRDQRIRGSVNVTLPAGPIVFGHRSMAEYRFRDIGNGWRYRPQFRLEIPAKLRATPVTPYLTGEGVYDFNEREWTSILTQAGLRSEITPKFTLTTFYQYQFSRGGNDISIVALGFSYRIGPAKSK